MEYTTLSGIVKTFIPGAGKGFTATRPPISTVVEYLGDHYIRVHLGLALDNANELYQGSNAPHLRSFRGAAIQDYYIWEQGTGNERLDGL